MFNQIEAIQVDGEKDQRQDRIAPDADIESMGQAVMRGAGTDSGGDFSKVLPYRHQIPECQQGKKEKSDAGCKTGRFHGLISGIKDQGNDEEYEITKHVISRKNRMRRGKGGRTDLFRCKYSRSIVGDTCPGLWRS